MILLLHTFLALSSPGTDPAIVRGEDLTAWETMERADTPPTAEALEAYVLRFATSPLAELAWAARLQIGPPEPAFVRRHRRLVRTLERSLATHRDLLRRPPTRAVPVSITPR